MLAFLRRHTYVLSNKVRRLFHPERVREEKWTANLSRLEKLPFDIKPENSHDAKLENGALVLGLKKTNCAAWVEAPKRLFRNQIIEARFRLDSSEGHAAAGLVFRAMDGFAYLALVSSRGRFRLDALKHGSPKPLIGWTVLPAFAAEKMKNPGASANLRFDWVSSLKRKFIIPRGTHPDPKTQKHTPDSTHFPEQARTTDSRPDGSAGYAPLSPINLTVIAREDHLIFLVNGRWIGEVHDLSAAEGRVGFALAFYETDGAAAYADAETETARAGASVESAIYKCRARLDFLSVESRAGKVEECYSKWNDGVSVSAESRFHLAETFAAMNAAAPALDQIVRAWKQREKTARDGAAARADLRPRKELLAAARMAGRLERYDEAGEYLDMCLEQGRDNPEGKQALAEKIKLLGVTQKFQELKECLSGYISPAVNQRNGETRSGPPEDLPAFYALLAYTHWNLREYESAAAAWDRAFDLDKENGLYTVNAANACVLLGRPEDALKRYLEGGRIFLRQDNSGGLDALVPKLLSLGEHNWEARALVGKWAFDIGDYDQAESELALSENIRRETRPLPAADPAVSYLRALLLARADKHREAFDLLEEAARLAPDYGLFGETLRDWRRLAIVNCPDVPQSSR
jgi:tetratricopeptide (TPR) repeat protein